MEMRACPFCASTDLQPSFHSHPHLGTVVCVSCSECDAEGPPIKVETSTADAISGAHALWNQRQANEQ